MSLFDAVKRFLGIQPPLVVHAPDAAFTVTEAARARLAELPPDQGVHIDTIEAERGRLPRAVEGESQGPPPPALDGLAITISDADLELLEGRSLHWQDGRWVIQVSLELRAQDTPNPDGRLYLASQLLATGRPLYFVAGGDDLPDLPALLLDRPGVRSVLLRDNTVAVEREPGTPWDAIDRGVDTALRTWLGACGRPLRGGTDSTGRDPIEDEIRAVLEEKVLPAVHRDGGTIELVGYSNGTVLVSLHGACRTCPSSTATLRGGVERTLREAFPGRIERVEAV
ncbi:MAG: NifU family protein [Alphaproteobacteria bacterium]|nr:NifU family protein [Alphaproteobacteria bacterium]